MKKILVALLLIVFNLQADDTYEKWFNEEYGHLKNYIVSLDRVL